MSMKPSIEFDSSNDPKYDHLNPIVDLLIANGNTLAKDERWHIDMTAIVCYLSKPIDFDLVESSFELSNDIDLNKSGNWIECAQTMSMIQGGND